MRSTKKWAAALMACLAVCAQAGESQVREALEAETAAAFARGDYKAIEARYAAARASGERTPSGLFVADVIARSVVPKPGSAASDSPGRDDYWLPVERKVGEWTRQFPHSALAAAVQSWAFLGHGWSWRGGGYARTVPEEGFRQFAAYAQRAHDSLMAREKAGRQDPFWYAQLLEVALLQSWDTDRYMVLVKQATQAFPQNHEIYFTIARRLQPRWGGSAEAIASFADFAVRQTRHAEGESMYARIYWVVGYAVDAELSAPDVDWKRIHAGFEDIVKRYPDRWNLNHYARMACGARDEATTRALILRIRSDVEPAAWGSRAAYLRCMQAAGVKREDLQ